MNVSANLQPTSPITVTPLVPTSGPPVSTAPPAPAPRCVVPRLGAKKPAAAKTGKVLAAGAKVAVKLAPPQAGPS